MAGLLIQHLRNKKEEHPGIQLLNAQWDFDQELIPKALQNISTIFPHYSRHDASHSRQILNNIERILGPASIKNLTATDTWLLIEAAHWHDIGMVVSNDQIEKDLTSTEFYAYVNTVASTGGHELQGFAKFFTSLDTKSCFAFAETPQQAMSLYRQLLAGWYRKKHPERAEDIVGDPWKEAGIASPRNELVPRRLFRILGAVCRLHGNSFESVLSQLYFSEAGMGNEDCHPRFVACLLRLGDLLDLDDNRFCPAMLRISGTIPPSSQAHLKKHAALRHMRMDPETIELIAECEDYESYEITDEWFSWIRDEVRNQMSNWKDIVPSREFGLLPTLGKMEVNLAPPNEILNPGERPRFGVEPEKVLELLQGAGIYENHWQCVRELLQNAVDATLMRVWLSIEPEPTNAPIDPKDPNAEAISKLLDQFPIRASLSRDPRPAGEGKVRWRLKIQDSGIGISKQDLNYMKKVGGSANNTTRSQIINRMPSWLKPSGAFGIGLQSAFLITDEIRVLSKSLLTGETLSIRMTSPLQRERGLIYIHRPIAIPASNPGTTLELDIITEAILSQISIPSFGSSITKEILAEFDPVCHPDVPYAAAKLAEEVLKFRELSPIKVHLKFDEKQNNDARETSQKSKPYYDDTTGISIIDQAFFPNENFQTVLAFRGQLIDKPRLHIPFVKCIGNILYSSATELLTINRNEIKDTASQFIAEQVTKTLVNLLINKKDPLNTREERIAASAFLVISKQEDARDDLKNLWDQLSFQEAPSTTIQSLCSKPDFSVALMGMEEPWTIPQPMDGIDLIVNSQPTQKHRIWLLAHKWRHLMKNYIQVDCIPEKQRSWILRFKREQIEPFSENGLRASLLNYSSNTWGIAGRCRAPVWGNFKILAANTQSIGWCGPVSFYQAEDPQFVLPFFFPIRESIRTHKPQITTQSLDALCSWTLKHTNVNATEVEIKKAYNDFIDYIDNDLMKDTPVWNEMRKKAEHK